MSKIDEETGVVISHCSNCGGTSTFEWMSGGKEYGSIQSKYTGSYSSYKVLCHRLFRCAGCGRGGFGEVAYLNSGGGTAYPGSASKLLAFYPYETQELNIPHDVPDGIRAEFREAEECLSNNCFRAAAGLFRSVLDKTMRSNGYKTKKESNLYAQIEAAADEGIITASRKRKAHDDVRVLGNDVLHDDWREITTEEVSLAHHYCQRILEDFYHDRPTVVSILKSVKRIKCEEQNTTEIGS